MGLLQLNPIRPIQWAALFLISFSCLLFLCAVATESYVSNSGGHTGAWQTCDNNGNCESISENCNEIDLSGNDCSKFRAFRAFLLIAFFLSVIVTVLTWIIAVESPVMSPYFATTNVMIVGFGWACSLSALISFSIIADLINNTWDIPGSKGSSFGLLVSAWLFHSIGMVAWTFSMMFETGTMRRSYDFDHPGVVDNKSGDYAPSAPAYANSSMAASEPTVVVVDGNNDVRGNPAVTTL